jgi:hypothetical protein
MFPSLLLHIGPHIVPLRPYMHFFRALLLFSLISHIFPIVGGLLSSIVPMNGPLSGGTSFTLTGGTFTTGCSTKTFTFNSVSATSVVVSAGTITGTVPAYVSGLTAPVTLSYTGSGGCTSQNFLSSTIFSYDSPVFDGVLYGSKDTLGGGSITISGKNFLPSGASIVIGSTSSSCVSVTSFVLFKCVIPAHQSGSRVGLDLVVSMNSVQTTLIKFAYDAPRLSSITPQIPKLDGISSITIFGSNLEANLPQTINVGSLSCQNVKMTTPHQAFSCVPSLSSELVKTNAYVRVSLFSGADVALLWTFELMNNSLYFVPQGAHLPPINRFPSLLSDSTFCRRSTLPFHCCCRHRAVNSNSRATFNICDSIDGHLFCGASFTLWLQPIYNGFYQFWKFRKIIRQQ